MKSSAVLSNYFAVSIQQRAVAISQINKKGIKVSEIVSLAHNESPDNDYLVEELCLVKQYKSELL